MRIADNNCNNRTDGVSKNIMQIQMWISKTNIRILRIRLQILQIIASACTSPTNDATLTDQSWVACGGSKIGYFVLMMFQSRRMKLAPLFFLLMRKNIVKFLFLTVRTRTIISIPLLQTKEKLHKIMLTSQNGA